MARPKLVRTFDREKYKLEKLYRLKSDAERSKKILKLSGYKVRISKIKEGYVVYRSHIRYMR